MFWSKNKKKKIYPCKPQFNYIKVGCKGMFVTRTCFRDGFTRPLFQSIPIGGITPEEDHEDLTTS